MSAYDYKNFQRSRLREAARHDKRISSHLPSAAWTGIGEKKEA
jgi:hypothetical protein